MAAVSVKK